LVTAPLCSILGMVTGANPTGKCMNSSVFIANVRTRPFACYCPIRRPTPGRDGSSECPLGRVEDHVPTAHFGTFAGDLYRLTNWFAECAVKTVVLESPVSTGSRFLNYSTNALRGPCGQCP
jgi:hypothetical protein